MVQLHADTVQIAVQAGSISDLIVYNRSASVVVLGSQ
jgi:hypothetical protein